MSKVIAINGSPQMGAGNTAQLLGPFIEGLTEGGAEVELFYASRLNVRSCACKDLYCWSKEPGVCCIKDDMDTLYPKLETADILVLATPVYIPLPGDMQNIINRLCALIQPQLETRDGRTRAKFRPEVRISKFVLVSTGGWLEIENFNTVVQIVRELAATSSVEFAGALLRPHAQLMKQEGELTTDGKSVLAAAKKAGLELTKNGAMGAETLKLVSRPLVSLEEQ